MEIWTRVVGVGRGLVTHFRVVLANAAAGRRLVLLGLLLIACAKPLFAGPPFQLDDPDVIPCHDFEFYTWGGASAVPGSVTTQFPAIEFNYSAVCNTMFHFILQSGEAIPSHGQRYFGLEDSEFGFQYRFIQETKDRPMIGTFIMTEIPTGSLAKGLGAGGFSWKLPLYAQKSFGSWTIDGGGGETVNAHVPGARNYPFGGTLLLRELSPKLTIGGEVFAHGKETTDPSSRYAAMLDLGGYYTPTRNPNFQILFAYGHSFAGQPETYAYAALYWTGDLHRTVRSLARRLCP
jgi:hypothetical protein